MYGDAYYDLVAAGSTATSAAGAHLLFGAYQGLSLLNNGEVVNLQLFASANHLRVWNSTVTNNTGFRLEGNATVDWPAMRAGTASALHVARETANNASWNWTVFRRVG